MNRDWEQDILEWVGDKQVKRLKTNNLIKFVISIFTAISGFGGGWYKMEQRVSALEEQMAKKENISTIELEIASLMREKELLDLGVILFSGEEVYKKKVKIIDGEYLNLFKNKVTNNLDFSKGFFQHNRKLDGAEISNHIYKYLQTEKQKKI